MTQGPPHLLTLAEVCRELRISIHTGRRLVRAGRLCCFGSGKLRRFTPEHVQSFLEGRTGRGEPARRGSLQ